MKQILKQFGDKQLLFSSDVNKVNKKFKAQNRVMLITENAVYNIDTSNFKVKRRIPIDEIDTVSVSSLPDGIFCMHVPDSYDYLYESDKKSEIIDIISDAKQKKDKDLKINVADKFDYTAGPNDVCSVSFVLDENVDESCLQPSNSGLVVHVKHDEPSVILEAAYVHIKDQPKPIEVHNNPNEIIKLRKKWKYKLEIRFYVNEHLQGCSFHEKIDTVTKRQEFISQVCDLEPREERYVIMLPERRVLYSILSKTRVKCKLLDALGKVLLAVRYVYDCH